MTASFGEEEVMLVLGVTSYSSPPSCSSKIYSGGFKVLHTVAKNILRAHGRGWKPEKCEGNMPPRDPSMFTGAMEQSPVVVLMAGHTMVVALQTEDIPEEPLDGEHNREHGRIGGKRPLICPRK